MINGEHLTVSASDSIESLLETLSKIATNSFGSGFAIIVNEDGIFLGTCTDSDFRKFVLRNNRLPASPLEVVNDGSIVVSADMSPEQQLRSIALEVSKKGWTTELPVSLVPILRAGKPIGIREVHKDDPVIRVERDQVVVIGLGFVGLTLAAAAAKLGLSTFGVETDEARYESLLDGNDYTGEPGVGEVLSKSEELRLTFCQSLRDLPPSGIGQRRVFIVCVNTPLGRNGKPSLRALESVRKELSTVIRRKDLVVLRSTVPVGFSKEFAISLERELGWQAGSDFFVASAPERTVEGNALAEVMSLPQLVGGVTQFCGSEAADFFSQIADSVVAVENSDAAELGKLISNAYRDYIFAFSNHIAAIARKSNLDVNRLIRQVNSGYERNNIPFPSPGVGGPCLSKDSRILESDSKALESPILVARTRNEKVPSELVGFLLPMLGRLQCEKILAVGIAFKGSPPTPDFRSSPGLEICNLLSNQGLRLVAWDAEADVSEAGFRMPDDVDSPDAVLILNNHDKNREYARGVVRQFGGERTRLVFDPWRILSPEDVDLQTVQYVTLSNFLGGSG